MNTVSSPGGVPTRHLEFDGLRIAYDDRILKPRPWTTAQSRWARELLIHLPDGPVLELCSGAGQIGLQAVKGLDRTLSQIDIDPVACDFATRNAESAGMSGQVLVRCGPMDEVLDPADRFVLIIADPPYVPTARIDKFPEDPALAIDGGTDGFGLIEPCLELISRHLLRDGAAIVQTLSLDQVAMVDRHLRGRPHLNLVQEEVRDCGRGGLSLLRRLAP